MKKVGNGLATILLIAVIIISAAYLGSSFQARKIPGQIPSVLGFSPLMVVSGSMSPIIETGDVIIINKDTQHIANGDIITYKSGNMLVTHRVMTTGTFNGEVIYTTKGDANSVVDHTFVTAKQIIGKYAFRIPYAGYLKVWLQGIQGALLVFGAALIIIMTAILKLTASYVDKQIAQLNGD